MRGYDEKWLRERGLEKNKDGTYSKKKKEEVQVSLQLGTREAGEGHIEIDIRALPKVRMTQSDRWKTDPNHKNPKSRQRPAVTRYFLYAKHLKHMCECMGITDLGAILGVEFYMAMPNSWSKKKKSEMLGKPHQQRPDLSNLIKAVEDILCKEDSHIWKYEPPPFKIWSNEDKIVFTKW